MTTIQFFRIDNLIVEKLPHGGIMVGPIKRYEKDHKVKLDLDKVPYISTGSRYSDNIFIQNLMESDYTERFENLPIIVHRPI